MDLEAQSAPEHGTEKTTFDRSITYFIHRLSSQIVRQVPKLVWHWSILESGGLMLMKRIGFSGCCGQDSDAVVGKDIEDISAGCFSCCDSVLSVTFEAGCAVSHLGESAEVRKLGTSKRFPRLPGFYW
jgi:hypothetical protein